MNVWVDQEEVIELLTDLGIDTSSWEASSYEKLNREILRAQRAFERLTRRKFEQTTVTERLDGTGKETIILTNFPVTELVSVTVENLPGYPYTLTLSEYRLEEETGILHLVSTQPFQISIFPLGLLSITATYKYGYLVAGEINNIPEDIQDCILYMVAIKVIMRTPADWEKLGLKAIRIAQYSESYGKVAEKESGIFGPQKEEWTRTINETIRRYKRIPIV